MVPNGVGRCDQERRLCRLTGGRSGVTETGRNDMTADPKTEIPEFGHTLDIVAPGEGEPQIRLAIDFSGVPVLITLGHEHFKVRFPIDFRWYSGPVLDDREVCELFIRQTWTNEEASG